MSNSIVPSGSSREALREDVRGTPTSAVCEQKSAVVFKKMLENKKAISEHFQKKVNLTDLKDKYHFLNPVYFYKT